MRFRSSLRLHAFIVLLLASNAEASDHDLQQWTSLRLEHEFFDGVTAGVRARVRFDDDVSSENDVMVGPSVHWEPIDRLTFVLGYDYLYDLQAESTAEHRAWQAINFTLPIRDLTLGNRIRFDERFLEDVSGAIARFRYRLRTSYDLEGLPLKGFHLTASEEVFVNLNDKGEGPVGGFEQNRVRAGAGWRLGRARVEAGYEWQYGRRRSEPWLHRHVVFVEFTFSPDTFGTE
jgi:hypothetical protein